jgi:hypothetical protein
VRWCKAHKAKKVIIVVAAIKGVMPPPMMLSTINDIKVGQYDGYDVRCTRKISA